MLTVVVILGTLSSMAIPSYFQQLCQANSAEAEATIGSLKAIISAYADETGTLATSWNDLDTISPTMGKDGKASGDFTKSILLPSSEYSIKISPPQNNIYTITANPTGNCKKRIIKACINLGTGTSETKKGDGENDAEDPICT